MSHFEVNAVLFVFVFAKGVALSALESSYHSLFGYFLDYILAPADKAVVGEDCGFGIDSFGFGDRLGWSVDHDVSKFVAENIDILVYFIEVIL